MGTLSGQVMSTPVLTVCVTVLLRFSAHVAHPGR
jgi:hypothetical protein